MFALCGSGSHGEAHVTEMRFLTPGCQSLEVARGQKWRRPATRLHAENPRVHLEPARALLVTAHEAGSGLSAVRDILNDPGFRR